MLEGLSKCSKVIGLKQCKKAVASGQTKKVYLAQDVEERIKVPVEELCRQANVEIISVPSMRELGKACGLQVSAAMVALVD